MFRSTTSAHKGLTPSGKIHLLFGCIKNICIFGLFQQLTTSVRCSMQGTHSTYPKVAVQWLNQALCFYQSFCLVDSESLRNRHLRVAAKRWPQV
jgi:hypothetical protein